MGTRRVVTGHDAAGKSVFASDEVIPPITLALLPGFEFQRLWGGDQAPHFPDDGKAAHPHAYFPPVGGFRFGTFTVAPNSSADDLGELDIEAALAEIEEHLPGMAGHMEPDAPGMHTTATLDFEYVVSGRVILELDDGATRELGPGDTVIQSGTRHAWRNPFDEPCVMVVAFVGAHHDAKPAVGL
jgi:mannose-6-phosphate isomerase-like protein (cupin superfamily)